MKALLIDGHALFRDALCLLIGAHFPDLKLFEAGDLASGLAVLAQHPGIRLVLLDRSLPDPEGADDISRLHRQCPLVRVVVLSADDRPATVAQAIEQGACGFVAKTSRAEVLTQALRTTLAGGVFLPSNGLDSAEASPTIGATPQSLGLSPRQAEVLRLLIDGQPNKRICRELGLSGSTVKTHLAAVFRRLDVNSRTQAVLAAARLRLRFAETTAPGRGAAGVAKADSGRSLPG